MASSPKPTYRAEKAAIHIVCQQAGMDEETRRAYMQRLTGKRSTSDMTVLELRQVLDDLAKHGYKTPARRGRDRVSGDRQPYLAKIDALLASRGRDRQYLASMVKRICKVDSLQFCGIVQLRKLVAALEYDARRHPVAPAEAQ